MHFPLLGRAGDFHPLERAHAGRVLKKMGQKGAGFNSREGGYIGIAGGIASGCKIHNNSQLAVPTGTAQII